MKKLLLGVNIIIFCIASYGQSNSHPGRVSPDSIKITSPGKIGDGSGTLGQSYVLQNVCGLNYTQSSLLTETRSISAGFNTTGTGFPASLPVVNLPCGASSIVKAYAYWSAEYTEGTAPNTSIVITNPAAGVATYTATIIGTGAYTYWTPANGTADYRADITASISGNGSYTVNLTGFANAGWEVDGVAIIIVYTDPSATYSGSISLWDGCIVNSSTNANLGPFTYTGFTACAASTTNDAFVLLGDCQTGIAGNGNKVTNDLNGSTASFPPAFWQLNTISGTTITSGQTSITDNTYTNNVGGDAFLWELAGLYWQNTTCVTCTPAGGLTYTNSITGTSCSADTGTAMVNVSGGTTPYTYNWSTGATTDSVFGLSAGTYTAIITSASGCQTATDIVTITSGSLSAVIMASKDSVCSGPGDTLTLWGSGGATYLWSPGGSTSSTIHINLTADSIYTLYSFAGGCEDSAKISLKVIPPSTVAISAGSDTLACPNGSTTLTAVGSGGAVTYKWSNGETSATITVTDTATTTYTVTVYGICDSAKATQKVTVVPLPKLSIAGNSSPCAGSKDTITVSSSTNPTTYLWSNGSTSTSYYTGDIKGDSTITVTATNSIGCTVTAVYPITEKLYPKDTLKYPPTCINNQATITAYPNGTGPFTYKWSTGGTNDTIIVPNSDTMTYTVTISNGCPITQTVTVNPDDPAMQVCCSATILIGQDTTIITLLNSDIVTYLWTPPNSGLNCYTCPDVIASPTTTTTYTVTGTDAAGCLIEQEVTITVDIPCYNPTVPNVFTPTTPGINSEFYINTTKDDISSWSLLIFDRWGKEVYSSTNFNQYWDGNTESGGAAPAGVYYYILSATCQSNTYKKDGFVQLIR